MLATAAAPKYLYLSPHYDDAAFSLGAWIAGRPGGLLVNIFTRSEFTSTRATTGVEAVSALRAAEDQAFAARTSLEAVALELEEPGLRGRRSRDRSGAADDAALLRVPLTTLLDRHAGAETLVFCPAGIGGHVNHLATRLVAWEWAVARGRETQLRFYEDLPYASRLHLRRRGLADLRVATAGWALRRQAWRAGQGKLDLVRLYPSQLDPEWQMRRFSPFSPWPPGRHEAVWVPVRQ